MRPAALREARRRFINRAFGMALDSLFIAVTIAASVKTARQECFHLATVNTPICVIAQIGLKVLDAVGCNVFHCSLSVGGASLRRGLIIRLYECFQQIQYREE